MEQVPNVRGCVAIRPGSAILLFGRHLETCEGLYLYEAQELAAELSHQVNWVGQPAMQQAYPISVAEG